MLEPKTRRLQACDSQFFQALIEISLAVLLLLWPVLLLRLQMPSQTLLDEKRAFEEPLPEIKK
ncbi:hypothetical protein EMIT0324P_20555 [Pseudomonas chlororaphis]